MSTVSGTPHSTSAIIELIEPFSESTDPRLRGNAVFALAALVSSSDATIARQAEEQLVQAVTSEPGNAGADWRRRFTQRALAAVGRLLPEARSRIAKQANETLRNAREPSQRASIATFLIAASTSGGPLPSIGWLKLIWLSILAGRPGFWQSVWAATWRISLVTSVFALAISLLPNELQPNSNEISSRVIDIVGIATVFLSLLAFFSVTGRSVPSSRVQLIDVAISGASLLLLAGIGVNFLVIIGLNNNNPKFLSSPFLLARANPVVLFQACGIGLLVGAAVRGMRWAATSFAIEPEGLEYLLRPTVAFCVTSCSCIAVAYLWLDASIAGAAWILLAPAAAVASWLDLWLEGRGPQPLSMRRRSNQQVAVLPVVAIVSAFIMIVSVYRNVSTVSFTPWLKQPGSMTAEAKTLVGRPVSFNTEKDAQYNISFRASELTGLALVVQREDGGVISTLENQDPSAITSQLSKGRYVACVKNATTARSGCRTFQVSATVEVAAFLVGGQLAVGGTSNKEQIVTILLSSSP
jgi:hypothetical protein